MDDNYLGSIFEKYLHAKKIFKNKEVLRHSYTPPRELPPTGMSRSRTSPTSSFPFSAVRPPRPTSSSMERPEQVKP